MSEEKTTQRVIRVPLLWVEDETWRDLRLLAYKCATYGNHLMNESYLKVKGFDGKLGVYKDHAEELSSGVRDAVGRECVGMWRRLGKKILRGEQTLGRFSADRSLVVRGRQVAIGFDDKNRLALKMRLFPKPKPITTLTIFPGALSKRHNLYLAETLMGLQQDLDRIGKAAIIFHRPGRKISVDVAYSKQIEVIDPADVTATLYVMSDGSCRLTGQQRTLTLSAEIYRMVNMKENFSRIHARIKTSLGKAHRPRDFRRTLAKTQHFEEWSQGPIHNLSHQIVKWCQSNGVGNLEWRIDPGAPALPWHQLQTQVKYKGEEIGLATKVTRIEVNTGE